MCGEVISLPTACLLHFCFLSLSQNPTIDRKCVLCVCVYGLDQCYSVHVIVPVHAHAYTHTHTQSLHGVIGYGGGVHSLKQNGCKIHITQHIPIPEW